MPPVTTSFKCFALTSPLRARTSGRKAGNLSPCTRMKSAARGPWSSQIEISTSIRSSVVSCETNSDMIALWRMLKYKQRWTTSAALFSKESAWRISGTQLNMNLPLWWVFALSLWWDASWSWEDHFLTDQELHQAGSQRCSFQHPCILWNITLTRIPPIYGHPPPNNGSQQLGSHLRGWHWVLPHQQSLGLYLSLVCRDHLHIHQTASPCNQGKLSLKHQWLWTR